MSMFDEDEVLLEGNYFKHTKTVLHFARELWLVVAS